VARLLNISPGTVYRLNDSGKMPKVIRIGSLVRWNRAAIEAWVSAGCPAVERRGVRRT
jgi:excisionase family DNA binding protein